MNGVTITWEVLLIAVVLATVVYLLEVALFSRRRKGPAKASAIKDLDLDVEGIHVRVSVLERQTQALRERLDDLQAASEKAERQQTEQQATPYAQAVQLARQGVSPQELAHRCGITNGEAELIVALNRAEP